MDVEFAPDDTTKAGRRVSAVVAYELATGDIHIFATKAVLFATGGFGKVFKTSSNAHTLTGDGPSLLFRRGVPLEDMEFFQFHPTGIYRLGILLSEAARGEGGILRNKDGERFMERYAPTVKDLAPRDMVTRAIVTEIREGRGAGPDADYVYLDLTHLPPEQIDAKLPDISDFARTYLGIEPKTEPVPILPTAHYAMGGIPTNVHGEVVIDEKNTVLPGLYAAGECACVSVHGSNRLGTNSLLDIVVFGKRGGRAMSEFVKTVEWATDGRSSETAAVARIGQMRNSEGGEKVAAIRTDLQNMMMDEASVFRTEETLIRAEQQLVALKARYENVQIDDKGDVFNYDLMEGMELENLLLLSEAVVAGAKARKESRGAHFREDYPTRDDKKWMKHTLVTRSEEGELSLSYKPVVQGPYEPMERKY